MTVDPTTIAVVLKPLLMPCRQCLAEPGAACRFAKPKGGPETFPEFHAIRERHAAMATALVDAARSTS